MLGLIYWIRWKTKHSYLFVNALCWFDIDYEQIVFSFLFKMAAANNTNFRLLLIDIGDRLSMQNRQSLVFFLGDAAPRQILDNIAHDSRSSMNILWDALIERQQIGPNNVNLLISCFQSIGRIDLVKRLKEYTKTPAEPAASFREADN